MTYNNESHIRSVEDVMAFFHHLVDERKLNFHSDNDFANCICHEAKTPSFTEEEVSVYNRLMEESFDVCETADEEIYEIGLAILRPSIGLF